MMRSIIPNVPDGGAYHELLQVLESDGRHIEKFARETTEKLQQMLQDDLFNQASLNLIRTLARDSIVKVPHLIDYSTEMSHLVIKSNERLEILVEYVKHEAFLFTENAEKLRCLIDLNIMQKNGVDYEQQNLWKNELVEMQGQISSNQMDILTYYKNRSDISKSILKQPRISDYWEKIIEIDEDFFYKLRRIMQNLTLCNLRLYEIVSNWIHCFH